VKGPDGEMRKQTNSRIIRWSDGSMSLLLGKELFDIQANADVAPSTPRGSQRAPPSQSQSSSQPTSGNYIRSQGLTYLVAQHKRAEILQSEALVSGFLSIRPTSMQSETHKMLVRAVGQKHNKVARLRMAPEMSRDPDRELAELQKSAAKSKTKRPKADDLGNKFSARRRSSGGRSRNRGAGGLYSDDEDEAEFVGSDEERESPKKKRTTGEYEADDFVVEDSDSDYDGGKSRSTKKRKAAKEDVEADSLDEMDASIERQRKREKATKVTPTKMAEGAIDAQGDDDAMDIAESEDEEEEDIRRIGTGSRKKIIYDDEEEEEE